VSSKVAAARMVSEVDENGKPFFDLSERLTDKQITSFFSSYKRTRMNMLKTINVLDAVLSKKMKGE
jgi:hypothetical protein